MTAHGISIAQLPGLAVLDQGRVVVLSCEAELAAHYTAHAPAAGQFSLQQPYQATAIANVPLDAPQHAARGVSRPAASANGAAETPPGDYGTPSEPHSLRTGADTAGCVTGQPGQQPVARRERKRKAVKAPNQAESEVWPGSVVARARVHDFCTNLACVR